MYHCWFDESDETEDLERNSANHIHTAGIEGGGSSGPVPPSAITKGKGKEPQKGTGKGQGKDQPKKKEKKEAKEKTPQQKAKTVS